ncbi:MAG: HD domain-containing protein [Candidatus Uhrbacteria bacterium]
MTRSETLNLLQSKLQNTNLIKHCLAVEAAMRGLAEHFSEDVETWGLAGLLHDVDYEKTKDKPNEHSKIGAQMVKDAGYSEEIAAAILTHNELHGIEPATRMAKALQCIDPLTGLVVAATLVLPSKKISDLKTESVVNRMSEKSFAKGANRELIKKCEPYLGLSIEQFVELVLTAMKKINNELGL